MMKRGTLLFIVLLLAAAPALAQDREGERPGGGEQPAQSAPATGVVTGHVVNGTEGGEVPASGEPMLHMWDSAGQEQGMEHGSLLPDGSFRFEGVPFVAGWRYAAMLTYEGVTYLSEPGEVEAGQRELLLPVTVYETTTATSGVHVAQKHVYFDAAAEGQVMVGEIYILSNRGDRTVVAAADSPTELAPLAFALPEGAEDISVENNRDGRFKPTERGFADTAPLRPGERTAEVVVRYTLPYEGALTYSLGTPWPVDHANLLVPSSSGITLAGEGLPAAEIMQMGSNVEVAVFDAGALKAGDRLTVRLSGAISAPPAATQEDADRAATPAGRSSNAVAPVAILLGVFSLALAGWFSRRTAVDEAVEPAQPEPLDALVTEIALLDEAHEAGQIDEQDHARRRSLLFEQAQQLRPEG